MSDRLLPYGVISLHAITKQIRFAPNIVVEWLTLLLRIRDVSGSNLGPETDYSESFSAFPQSVQANAATVP
jgi:hypothetical protein